MKPYSKDLRLRVLSAVDSGKPREEVAKTFSVSMPTIKLAKETSRNRRCEAQADPRQTLQEA
jgi:transposase